MTDRTQMADHICAILDAAGATYVRYDHRPVLSYDDIEVVAKETGWTGTEMKSLVMKGGDEYIVYVTRQGVRSNNKAMKAHLGVKKLRMVTPEELAEKFSAQPGNAYPFGFDSDVRVLVDPAVFEQEWMLFSPCREDQTVQVQGGDLERVFTSLPNTVEVIAMNEEG